MAEEPKKISFGFSKVSKKPAMIIQQNKEEKDFQFIESLEDNSIKLANGEEKDKGPLVIPLKNANILRDNMIETLKQRKEERASKKLTDHNDQNGKEEVKEEKPLTLDELAAKEILEDLKNKQEEKLTPTIQEIPTSNINSLGEKESTLEDYENVPVQEFGLAVLRGMGWAPDKGIGKNGQIIQPTEPVLRPKGMGLGADKVMHTTVVTSSNEELVMKKNAMLKIVNGPYKNLYGKIEGFDELPGRLMVRLTLQNTVISISENLVQLVPSSEYNKFSKILNLNDYNEFNEKKDIQSGKNNTYNEDREKREPSNDKYEKSNQIKMESLSPNRLVEKKQAKHRSPSADSTYYRERVNKQKKQISKRSNSEFDENISIQRRKRSPSEDFQRNKKDRLRSPSPNEQYEKSRKADSESNARYKTQKKRSPSVSSDSEEEQYHKRRKDKKIKPPESSDSEDQRSRKEKKDRIRQPPDSEEEKPKKSRKEKKRKSFESSDSEEEQWRKRKKQKKRSPSSSNESEERYQKVQRSKRRNQSSDSEEEYNKKKQKNRNNSQEKKKKHRKQKSYKNSSDSSESEKELRRKHENKMKKKHCRKNKGNVESSPERLSKHKRSHNQEKHRSRSRSPSKKKKKKKHYRSSS